LRDAQVASLGPRVLPLVKELVPGETSEIVRFEDGLWIFEFLDSRESRLLDFSEAEAEVRTALEKQRMKSAIREVRSRFVGESEVVLVSDGEGCPERVDAKGSRRNNFGFSHPICTDAHSDCRPSGSLPSARAQSRNPQCSWGYTYGFAQSSKPNLRHIWARKPGSYFCANPKGVEHS
jgi:hypothetical protein